MKIDDIDQRIDDEYYMTEGCGVFALALAKVKPGGKILIIVNKDGEEWSDEIPFEVTHVFYSIDNNSWDVKGDRSHIDMANDLGLSQSDIRLEGPMTPREFEQEFIGNDDTFPLYGERKDIEIAVDIIKNSSRFFKLN